MKARPEGLTAGLLLMAGAGLLSASMPAVGAADFAGKNGTFHTEVGKADPHFKSSRDDIRIKYTPDKTKVTCKKIYLCQTVQRTDQGGGIVFPKDLPGGDKAFQQPEATFNGTVVDHKATEKDPYTNGEDFGKDKQSQGVANATTETPTEMYDSPLYLNGDLPAGVTTLTLNFEVCAVCLDDNKVLDCTTWKYVQTLNSGNNGVITGPAAASDPTAEFKTAKQVFEETHKQGTVCPEAIAENNKGQKNVSGGHEKVLPEDVHPGQSSQVLWPILNTSGVECRDVHWKVELRTPHGTTVPAAGSIPFLDYFDRAVVSFPVGPVPAGEKDTVALIVDPFNQIPEYDEGDNVSTFVLNDQGLVAVGELPAPRAGGHIQVSPSPFRARTSVGLDLETARWVEVRIFDAVGRLVNTLFRGRLDAGGHSLEWNGRNAQGQRIPSGVYWVRVDAGDDVLSASLVRLE